jgi:hypothetical protein
LQKFLFILIAFFAFNTSNGQCYLKNTAYQVGEVIEYEVYYNWGLIWLNAGWVKFQVKSGTYNKRETYLFDSYGSSHKSYDWLFKVRDQYISHLDKETLLPLYFHRVNYEGGFELDNKYIFNTEKSEIYSFTKNSHKAYSEDTVAIPNCTFDILSLVYYARNIDFSKMKISETVPVVSIIDNEVFNLYIRYLGKENIEDKEGKTYSCIKFSTLLIEGTIFKGGEDMFVWITNDANKIPVLIEAKILIGSIKAYLKNAEGLRTQIR